MLHDELGIRIFRIFIGGDDVTNGIRLAIASISETYKLMYKIKRLSWVLKYSIKMDEYQLIVILF